MSITVDDQAPSVVQSGGVWFHSGSTNEFDSTTSVALSDGATLTYSFTGSQIGVFGTLDSTSGGIVATYAIDSGTPQSVTYKAAPAPAYRQPFWQSDTLTSGQHQLVVTVVNVNSTSTNPPKTGHIWFDYFSYLPSKAGVLPTTTPGSTTTTTTSSTTTTTSSSTTSTPTSISTPASSTTTTSSSAPTTSVGSSSANGGGATSKSNDGPNIGLIVGTSLAGALFVIACFALIFFFIRRNRRQRLDDELDYVADDDEHKIVAPSQLRHNMAGNVYAQNGGYPSYPVDDRASFAPSASLVPVSNGYPGVAPGTPSGVPLIHGQGYSTGPGGEQYFDPYAGQHHPPPVIRLPSQMNLGPEASAPSPPPNYYGNTSRRQ